MYFIMNELYFMYFYYLYDHKARTRAGGRGHTRLMLKTQGFYRRITGDSTQAPSYHTLRTKETEK